MKKIIFFLTAAIAALTITSCQEKFTPGSTETKNLSGNWVVSIYAPGEEGYEFYTGCEIITYNTSANLPTEMWLEDDGTFWEFKCKIDCNNSNYTIGKDKVEYENVYYESCVKIWGGKVTEKGAVAPGSESVVDKIEFFAAFDDDSEPYAYPYYFVGYRKTGFPEDNEAYMSVEDLPAIPTDY